MSEPLAFNRRIGAALGNALAGYKDGDTKRAGEGLCEAIFTMRAAWQQGYNEGYAAARREERLIRKWITSGEDRDSMS